MDDFYLQKLLLKFSVTLVPGMFAIVCHEVSHGYVAWRLGDPTARMLGRLTLNPLKHFDFLGTLMLFIVGFGWAKPVPVLAENLRNPKRDMIWVAAAGPVTNIVLAIISAFMLRGLQSLGNSVASGSLLAMMLNPVILNLAFSVQINLMLAIFNMIPLPPLDGGRVLMGLLPMREAQALSRIEPYGFFIIIMIVFVLPRYFGIDIFYLFIEPLMSLATRLLSGS